MGLYFPPVFAAATVSSPPHKTISLPVHTAVCPDLALGAPVVLVGVHVLLLGSYLPPVLRRTRSVPRPPQTINWLPVHTAVWPVRMLGALFIAMAIQLLVTGLYRAPVFRKTSEF